MTGLAPAGGPGTSGASLDSLPVWVATNHGMKCDGVTDDSAALTAFLNNVWLPSKGGTLYFPSLALINSQITLPYTVVGSDIRQPPLCLKGNVAPNAPGQTGDFILSGGLDLRYAGRTDTGCSTTRGSAFYNDPSAQAGDVGQWLIGPGVPDQCWIMAVNPGVGYATMKPARATASGVSLIVSSGKLQTFGLGVLTLENLVLCDQGTSSMPLVLTTQTAIRSRDCAHFGNPGKGGASCDQDSYIFGGPGPGCAVTSSLASGTAVTALPVNPLPVALSTGAKILLAPNTANPVTLTVAAPAAVGAATIQVNSFTPAVTYPTWTTVNFQGYHVLSAASWQTSAGLFQGYGSYITGAPYWANLRRLIVFGPWINDVVIENGNFGQSNGTNLGAAPSTLTAPISGTVTSLPVTALSRAVLQGDTIQVGAGQRSVTFTASADTAAAATAIPVTSQTLTATIPSGTVVFDVTAGVSCQVESFAFADAANNFTLIANNFDMAGGHNFATIFHGATTNCNLLGNTVGDGSSSFIASHRFDTGASWNFIQASQTASGGVLLDDQTNPGVITQTVVDPRQSMPSQFPQGMNVNGQLSTSGYWTIATSDPAGNEWYWVQQGTNGSQYHLNAKTAGGTVYDLLALNTYQNGSCSIGMTSSLVNGNSIIAGVGTNLLLQSASGMQVYLGDNGGRPYDVYVQNGNLGINHLLATNGYAGTNPTVAAAGGSTAVSLSGASDTAHSLALTTAAAVAVGTSVATVTYGLSYSTRAPVRTPRITVTPTNGAAAAALPFVTGNSQTGYSVALQNPPTIATAMTFDVHVIAS